MRCTVAAFLAIIAVLPAPAVAGDRSGADIRKMLSGNTITSPEFGCIYFSGTGRTVLVDFAGQSQGGTWSVAGDLYFSSGSCGETGCRILGDVPEITFVRTDGGFRQTVTLLPGNQCEKDAVIL